MSAILSFLVRLVREVTNEAVSVDGFSLSTQKRAQLSVSHHTNHFPAAETQQLAFSWLRLLRLPGAGTRFLLG